MTNQTWTLREPSLDRVVPRAAIYEGAAHTEALSRLLFVIEQHRRCGLLFGPPGSGKSVLLQQVSQIARRAAREVAVVDAHGRTAGELLWELSGELGLSPRFGDGPFILWRRILDRLLGNQVAQAPAIIILDHADQGGDETNALISRLVHLAQQERGLTLILAVRAESLSEIPSTVREATDLRIELGWLDRQQAGEFVHTLFQSTEDEGPLFEPAAIDQLHALSEGSPRMLSRLADLSILAALANDEQAVTEQTVLSAAADLQLLGSQYYRSAELAGTTSAHRHPY